MEMWGIEPGTISMPNRGSATKTWPLPYKLLMVDHHLLKYLIKGLKCMSFSQGIWMFQFTENPLQAFNLWHSKLAESYMSPKSHEAFPGWPWPQSAEGIISMSWLITLKLIHVFFCNLLWWKSQGITKYPRTTLMEKKWVWKKQPFFIHVLNTLRLKLQKCDSLSIAFHEKKCESYSKVLFVFFCILKCLMERV